MRNSFCRPSRSFWTLGVPIDPTVASYATQLFFNHPEQPEPVSSTSLVSLAGACDANYH